VWCRSKSVYKYYSIAKLKKMALTYVTSFSKNRY